MTLNFQNKIVFPAPETSYTTQSAFGQVIYLPRNIMDQAERKFSQNRKHLADKGKGRAAAAGGSTTTATSASASGNDSNSSQQPKGDADDDSAQAYIDKSQANLEERKSVQDKRQQVPVFSDNDPLAEEIKAQQDTIKAKAPLDDVVIIKPDDY